MISRRYMRMRIVLALGLLLATAGISFQITRSLSLTVVERAALAEALDDVQLGVATAMLALHEVAHAEAAQRTAGLRGDLERAAGKLKLARAQLVARLDDGAVAPETRRIITDPLLDPIGALDELERLATSLALALDQPILARQRASAAGVHLTQRLLPLIRRIKQIERSAQQQAADRLNGGAVVVLALSILVLLGTALFLFLPLERRVLASQAEIEQRRRAAEEASAAKTQFLATMSHEIRTPMNGVLGMAEVLRTTGLSPKQGKMLDIIQKSGVALMEIIDAVLDLAKIEAGRLTLAREPFEVARVCEEVASLFSGAAAAKGITLAVEIDPALPPRHVGDAGALRQVLSNLVGNAVKFTDHGAITVTARALPKGFEISVRDTGIGIPREAQERVFDSFEQADASTTRRFGGTGLGLAIVRRLTEAMGGAVSVQSTPGSGSVFHIVLPLEPRRAMGEAADAQNGAVQGQLRAGLHVLVAEDNAVNQIVTGAMLRNLGCTVTMVEDGRAAVAAAASEPFDIAFLDVAMPGMNGYEAARAIRAAEAAAVEGGPAPLPLVALSAHAMAEQREEGLRAGMDAFLTKPVAIATLRDALIRHARRDEAAQSATIAHFSDVAG